MMELRSAETDQRMKDFWSELIDELLKALADDNHPINKNHKEVG